MKKEKNKSAVHLGKLSRKKAFKGLTKKEISQKMQEVRRFGATKKLSPWEVKGT